MKLFVSIARKFSGLLSDEVSRMGQDSVHGAYGGCIITKPVLDSNVERKYAKRFDKNRLFFIDEIALKSYNMYDDSDTSLLLV